MSIVLISRVCKCRGFWGFLPNSVAVDESGVGISWLFLALTRINNPREYPNPGIFERQLSLWNFHFTLETLKTERSVPLEDRSLAEVFRSSLMVLRPLCCFISLRKMTKHTGLIMAQLDDRNVPTSYLSSTSSYLQRTSRYINITPELLSDDMVLSFTCQP